MNTTTLIRRFIFSIPKNRIFTTRELLNLGPRGAVNQALWQFVKSGLLVRLARGVFTKEESKPTAFEVAQAKCRAYGKEIAQHGSELAKELQLSSMEKKQVIFTTNGRSSSFWFGNILIIIKGISQRKMLLNTTKVGRAIAALWYMGKNIDLQSIITKATLTFNASERQQLRQSCPLMPEWISCFFARKRITISMLPSRLKSKSFWSLEQVVMPLEPT